MQQLMELIGRAQERCRTTDKYRWIDTQQLIDRTSDTLWKLGVFNPKFRIITTANRRARTTKHVVRVELSDLRTEEGIPLLLIENSFNGESSLTVRVGFYRLVCSNGLIMGQNYFYERIIHRVGERVEQQLDELDVRIAAAINYVQHELERRISLMKSIQLVGGRRAEVVRSLGLSPKATAAVLHTVMGAADNSLWTVYNDINEVLRRRGRSEYADYNRNTQLMDSVVQLALAA